MANYKFSNDNARQPINQHHCHCTLTCLFTIMVCGGPPGLLVSQQQNNVVNVHTALLL